MGEINCNQQSVDLDGEANLGTKWWDLCFNDFYWCFVVPLFIIVKYFGWCSNEKQSVKPARLMRLWYSPKVVMDGNRNMASSPLSSPFHSLRLLQLLVIFCIFKKSAYFQKKKKNKINKKTPRSWGYLIPPTHWQEPPKVSLCAFDCTRCIQRQRSHILWRCVISSLALSKASSWL